ncbi:hypothetical protein M422DRAFT_242124 [Sphaerobolus stellatus SS14]|nr:hypothetical protein M422DRAFT_242124 [Sphaerobolus stellatus SS14]
MVRYINRELEHNASLLHDATVERPNRQTPPLGRQRRRPALCCMTTNTGEQDTEPLKVRIEEASVADSARRREGCWLEPYPFSYRQPRFGELQSSESCACRSLGESGGYGRLSLNMIIGRS